MSENYADKSSIPSTWEHVNPSSSSKNYNYESDIDFVIKVLESVFDSLEKSETFYYEYGRECGFDVRKESIVRDKKTKIVKSREWVCSCAGHKIPLQDGVVRVREPKPETRCDCKASFRVGYEDGHYVVKKFEPRHNHELATNETRRLLKCNRYVAVSYLYYVSTREY